MQVIATAGHVDHGKSTLVWALTGMEPDRWAEEQRRGMTIDLGYAWTRLDSGEQLAFVDVPGHERFVTNMLAGIGPARCVLLVIAADKGWGAQTSDHVRALDALQVRRGLVVATRSDLADPELVIADAAERLASTSLAKLPILAVSSTTGQGVAKLRGALNDLFGEMPEEDAGHPVRLWVDRSFSLRGAGTVVTGTLPAGTVRRGDTLHLGARIVSVRGIQCLGESLDLAVGPARVALNLRGVDHKEIKRGNVLVTPHAWRSTSVVDARTHAENLPSRVMAHIGAAAVAGTLRVLSVGRPDGEPTIFRLRLQVELPLLVGDRLLLRDPGQHEILGGATVLDPAPPAFQRRGAASARGLVLRQEMDVPGISSEVARRGATRVDLMRAIGVAIPTPLPLGIIQAGSWLVSSARWDFWKAELRRLVAEHTADLTFDVGLARSELVRSLALPSSQLLQPLIDDVQDLEEVQGRVQRRGWRATLRPDVAAGIAEIVAILRDKPFSAPDHVLLARLRLGHRELVAAAAAGHVICLPGDVVLLPDAAAAAAKQLATLPPPFTASAAREALATSRRVTIPLLEHLDRVGITVAAGEGLRRLRVAGR
jgi:selenocysteine-specific elongation factor